MPRFVRASVAALLFATQLASAADWELADAETVRLAPENIEALPPAIRLELERRGCTIPQVWGAERPGNFVSGRFFSSTQMDIAVLCSRKRISSILVFRRGATDEIAELAEEPDINYLQVMDGEGRIGFSRFLAVARPEAIRSYHATQGGPPLPGLEHDGIEDAFVEKTASVWYFDAGRWLQLPGGGLTCQRRIPPELRDDVNGANVAFAENVFYDFRDRKIAEVRSVIDKVAIEQQLQAGASSSRS